MRFGSISCVALSVLSACGAASAQTPASPPAPPSTTDAGSAAQLPPVEVVGRGLSGRYVEPEAPGATRTDTPLREVPQSVRVLPRQLLDDVGATRLSDTFDYVSGVSRQNNFGGTWDNFSVRGFSGNESSGPNFLRNGLGGNRGISPPHDTANIDRIEFLKGPAAAVYGSSEPGGTLNIVTKKPLFQAANSAEFYLGNYGAKRLAVDSTGPLAAGLAYRINVAAEDNDGWRDYIDSKRLLVAPALAWRLDADTTLAYDGEYLRQRSPFDRGIVAVGGRIDALPRSRFIGEPNDGDFTVWSQTHTLALERRLNEQWQARAAVSYRGGSLDGYSSEATALQADNATLRRQRRYRDFGSQDRSFQAELVGQFSTGGLAHQLVAGVDAYRFEYDTLLLRVNPTAAAPYAINVDAPVYGQPQPTPLPNTDTAEHQRNAAFYLQDELSLSPQWKLLGGVRIDRYRQVFDNNRSGLDTTQAQSATSPRVGITWLPGAEWSVYATAGRSFRPNTGTDAAGGAFDPERGRAVEGGIKYERADHLVSGTLAVFDIKKRNVVTADPAHAGYSLAAGEARSRGAEFDLAGQLTRNLRLTASYAWLDAEVTRDNTIPSGTRLINVPRSSGSALAVWEDGIGSGRYGAGGGVTYVGARTGDALGSFMLPSYTTAKLVAYWRINSSVRLSLDIDNVFDRNYAASSYSSVWIAPGAPRLVTLGAQVKF